MRIRTRMWLHLALVMGAVLALDVAVAPSHAHAVVGVEEQLKSRYLGARILLVEDGVVAVEMARLTDYDLILMDMQMPRMNGVDATKAVRALPGRRHECPHQQAG